MQIHTRPLPLFLLLCLALLPAFGEEAPSGGKTETVTDTTWDETEIFYAGEITVTGTRTEKRLADSPVAYVFAVRRGWGNRLLFGKWSYESDTCLF
jgi:hypothetical protein